jgi:acetoin utilization protein AcuB
MLVETWMSRPVITVGANDSMQKATALLKKHYIRILPVLEDGKLVGIITCCCLNSELLTCHKI